MYKIFLGICIIFCIGCKPKSNIENKLSKIINKKINLNCFSDNLIRHPHGKLMSFTEFREFYDFITIIYLSNDCRPCYIDFIEWQNKIDSISQTDNHTLLFVVKENNYEIFMEKVLEYGFLEDKYYTTFDTTDFFLLKNNYLPYWAFNSGILIDKENKIKMVGKPWVNDDMLKLFYKTIDYKE